MTRCRAFLGRTVLSGLVALAASFVAAPAARAGLENRTVCVVSASTALAESWAALLREHKLAVRVIDAIDLDQVSNRPDALACGAVFATSDTALFWQGHPGAWRAAANHPLILMGAAAELAPPQGLGSEAARFERASGHAVTLGPRVMSDLGLSTSLPHDPDGRVALYREDVPMRQLVGIDGRRATDVEPLGKMSSAEDAGLAVTRYGQRVLWGFGGTPDTLTGAGRALLAALVERSLPPDPDKLAAAELAKPFSPDPEDAPSPEDGESLGLSSAPPPKLTPAQSARKAPSLTFRKSFAGAPSSFDGLNGRVSLVVFWATWCGWCRQEMPEVQRLHDALSRKGVNVLLVSIDKRYSTVDDYLRRTGITVPTAVTDPGAQKAYGLNGVPAAALIDRSGRLRAVYTGAGSFRLAKIQDSVDALLANR